MPGRNIEKRSSGTGKTGFRPPPPTTKKPPALDGFTRHVLDLLEPWQPVEARRMFGGIGLYSLGLMFAIIFDEMMWFKESYDEDGKPIKAKFKKEYFAYERDGRIIEMGYYEVPERAFDDGAFMIQLAEQAFRSAVAKASKKKPAKKRSRR